MGEHSVVEPVSADSSACSPPTKRWLPVRGREGSGYSKLGLALLRCAAATSLAGSQRAAMALGRVSKRPSYTERLCVRAGVPADASVPCPREPRLVALAPLLPFFPSQATIVSLQVGPRGG